MDPCCWMCISLNKNSGWRWIAMGFDLLDVYHSQGKSMDGMEVKNRHKLGGPGSTPGSRTAPNYGNLYLDGLISVLG
ncbi:hypothetical protein F2Q68_00033362 [Brassica cretica]|uniref:Uncharacterized protein n=1 Tax=Brassica cretica TaxID=69181 RepID=A0A8S9GZ33_BRACR|nr:hypothetical protein F2Q68_00033362 [Brassica cretica]